VSEWPAEKDQPTVIDIQNNSECCLGGVPLNKAGSLLLNLLHSEAFKVLFYRKLMYCTVIL